jgi:hypothetical protein
VQAADGETARQVAGRPGSDNTEIVLRDMIRICDEAIARRHRFYRGFLRGDFRVDFSNPEKSGPGVPEVVVWAVGFCAP